MAISKLFKNYQPVKRAVKREGLIINRKDNNTFEFISIPRGAVFSGGGGKGIAYAGMIEAMEETSLDGLNTVLQGITHISGASAGAMASSLVAMSMPAQEITTLLKLLNVMDAMDPTHFGGQRGKGDRFRNLFEVIYCFQIDRLLSDERASLDKSDYLEKYGAVDYKIKYYKTKFEEIGIHIKSVDDFINLSTNKDQLEKLDEFFNEFDLYREGKQGDATEQNPWITFADLETIKAGLPEQKKHLLKGLNVVTTDHSSYSEVSHNYMVSPHQSLAQQVLNSGAHPLIFHHQEEIVKNSQGIEEIRYIRDGGIINNFPIQYLLDQNIPLDQILGATLNPDKKYELKLNELSNHEMVGTSKRRRFLDKLLEHAFGGRVLEGRQVALENQKILNFMESLIPINSCELGTLSLNANQKQKDQPIQLTKEITINALKFRKKTFTNPLEFFLHVGESSARELYDSLFIALEQTNDQEWFEVKEKQTLELVAVMSKAKLVNLYINNIVSALESNDIQEILHNIEDLEFELSQENEQNTLLGLCYFQIQFLSNGLLTKFLNENKQQLIASKIDKLITNYDNLQQEKKNSIKIQPITEALKNPDADYFILKVTDNLRNQLSSNHHGYKMVSEDLLSKIQQEAQAILKEILAEYTDIENKILSDNREILISETAGEHSRGLFFNVKLNSGYQVTGLTQIYSEYLKPIRVRDRSEVLYEDTLSGNIESRKIKIKSLLTEKLEKHAGVERIVKEVTLLDTNQSRM